MAYRKPPRLRELAPEERAYLAGIIDGEGWIGTRHVSRRAGDYFQAALTVASTDRRLMRWLHRTGAGNVARYRRPHDAVRAVAWYWRCTGYGASDVIAAVLPFLIIKRRQAELALELQGSPQLPATRAALAARISNLNGRKGVKSRGRYPLMEAA